MRRGARAVLAALLAAVAVPAAAPAGTSPRRLSAEGRISLLGPLRITVHGRAHDLTCRIGPLAPQKLGYARGLRAAITCDGGLLVRIAGAKGTVSVAVAASGGSKASASSNARTELDFVGPIAGVSAASISFGSHSCRVGPGSPAVGALHAGDRVHAHCTDGVLTSIAAA